MSRFIVFFLTILCLSCAEQKKEVTKTQTAFPYAFDYSKFEGIYEGEFSGRSIRIVLNHVSGRHATGYNLHKGMRRNISGKMSFSDSGFVFLLNEPGDHKYDGIFQFAIDTVQYELRGTWQPLTNDNLQPKAYVLSKKVDGEEYLVFSDSTAVIYFEEDGLCKYEFYPTNDEKQPEQLIHINGNWTLKGNDYIVDWEPNDVFPDRRSVLKANEDSTQPGFFSSVTLGDRTLYMVF